MVCRARLNENHPLARARQDEANEGAHGAVLMAIAAESGDVLAEQHFAHLPRWDGMAAANGQLFVVTECGEVLCLADGTQ